MDLLEGLNSAQRQAVLHGSSGTPGPLAVLAGPGTGKTRVITHRLAHLIVEQGVDAASICALTFTIKAAGEMRTRLRELLAACGPTWAPKASLVQISTYHSLGRRILYRFADRAGLPREPRLVDAADLRRLARDQILAHGLMGKVMGQGADAAAEIVLKHASAMANAAVTLDAARAYARQWGARLASLDTPEAIGQRAELARFIETTDAVAALQAEQKRRGWIGFDDFITLPIELIRRDRMARDIMQGELRHAVVDEFQDVNAATIVMLSELFPGTHGKSTRNPDLCVVGDDDQAIYGFRGADQHAFARFAALWPPATTITLDENYRCSKPVIAAASRTISHAISRANADKTLRAASSRPPDAPDSAVELVHCEEERATAEVIASIVLQSRSRDLRLSAASRWDKYAVLARTNGELDRLQAAFELEGIPVQRRRRAGVLDDEGVQDIIAWCRLLIDPKDHASARRLLLRPPIGLSAAEVTRFEPAYRNALRDVRLRGSEHPGDYAAFLAAQAPGDARLARFGETLAAFAARGQTGRADQLVYELAIHTGVVHADLLAPEHRAERVQSVVRFIQFAQERQPTLPAPGAIEQFLELLPDFEDSDELGIGTADRIDGSADQSEAAEQPDAVRLLTAHASKGLEFDTVIVARVISPHGFPKSGGSRNSAALPQDLIADTLATSSSTLDDDDARTDEERRIFYVACTRAIRRLVLVGRIPDAKSTATAYLSELLASPPVAGPARSGSEILAETPSRAGELQRELESVKDRASRRERIAELASRERSRAASALASVERLSLSEMDLREVSQLLTKSAERLAIIAQVGATGSGPAWADAADVNEIVTRLGKPEAALPATLRDIVRPPSPPLSLSYSQLKDYERCPACFWCRHLAGLVDPPGESQELGNVVHAAMERFANRVREADAEGREPPTLHDLQAIGREIIGISDIQGGIPREADLVARVAAQLSTAYQLAQKHASGANILLIEHRAELPFVLDALPGVTHTIKLRIDRVEQRADGSFAIIDYKTGKASEKLLKPPLADLQLGLYAIALMQHQETSDLPPGGAEYHILSAGEVGRLEFKRMKIDKVRQSVSSILSGILAGDFPRGKDCTDGPCRVFVRA